MSLKNLKNEIRGLVTFLKESEAQLQVLTASNYAAIFTQRAFNNQEGSENATGQHLGIYSPEYAKIKAKKYGALLSTKVNLFATGTLFGSVKPVLKDGKTTLAVTDVKYPKGQSTVEVSEFLDKQYGEIFAPQEKEIEQIVAIAGKFINKRINEYVNRTNT